MAPSSSSGATNHALAPSIEEAYRRKCIQLKQRTAEVEEANDAARLRLQRLNRQAEKMRIERAFLLEQLAKRTSANVEDSDGSPSPPPTPKDKPLRTKRGHRKPSAVQGMDSIVGPSAFSSQTAIAGQGASPVSDVFIHANGVPKPKKPSNAFELYCNDLRPGLEAKANERQKATSSAAEGKDKADDDSGSKDKDKARDDNVDSGEAQPSSAGIDQELARGWKDLPEAEKAEFQSRYEKELAKYHKEKEVLSAKKARDEPPAGKEDRPAVAAADEDVEMANYDTEPDAENEGTPAAGAEKD